MISGGCLHLNRQTVVILFVILFFLGCDNPFAPKYGNNIENVDRILPQTKVENIFINIKYAYLLKDTTVYSALLDNDFLFSYRDYEKNIEISWNKQEELRITNSLFQNSKELNLTWNDILAMSADSSTIIRNFQLSIRFNTDDFVRIDGKVKFVLKKKNNLWYIYQWYDDSNF